MSLKKLKEVKPIMVFGEKIPVTILPIEDAGGYYYPGEKRIEIDSNLPDHDFYRVLLHEIMHSALDRVSLSGTISSELEEVIVDTLSKVVVENFSLKQKTIKGLHHK